MYDIAAQARGARAGARAGANILCFKFVFVLNVCQTFTVLALLAERLNLS